MAMKTRQDRLPYHTGIHDRASLSRPARCSSSIITFGPQPNKAIVGENAFAHEAGIHQDGYLKERSHIRNHRSEDRSACPKAGWCWASTAAVTR